MNHQTLAFLSEYVNNGGNGSKALLVIRPELTLSSAGSIAARMLAEPEIQAHLADMRESARINTTRTALLTMQDRREILAEIANATPRKLREGGEDSRAVQSVKQTEWGKEYKTPDKIAAIKLDAQLAGELLPERVELSIAPDVDDMLARLTDGAKVVEAEVVEHDEFSADLMG